MEGYNDVETGRVRRSNSTDKANEEIDPQTLQNMNTYGYTDPLAIAQWLKELDKEWDVERVLGVNASTLAMAGLVARDAERQALVYSAGRPDIISPKAWPAGLVSAASYTSEAWLKNKKRG
jgi:hypothetical protein